MESANDKTPGNGHATVKADPVDRGVTPPPAHTTEPTGYQEHHANTPRLNDPHAAEGKSHGWVWLIVLAVVVTAGVLLYPRIKAKLTAQPVAGGKNGGSRTTPVVVQTIKKGSLKVYLDGLGTVTPFNSVTVRSRVDGQITKIYFKEGQLVKQGDPLIDIDNKPFEDLLAQAQGAYERDAAQLASATSDLKHDVEAGSAIAVQQLEQQQAAVAQFKGALAVDQGQIDSANTNIKYCHITAPIGGLVGLRLIDRGNIVHASDTTGLVVVNQLQPISIIFSIPQDDIPRVIDQKDGGVGLTAIAYNRDLTKPIDPDGTLLAVDSQVDPSTGMVKLKASFKNKKNTLFPNQFVNIKLLVDTLKDVVIAPNAAIQQGPDWQFAYVVKEDNTVELRKITTGQKEGERTVITEGLDAGDRVVTDGVDKLTDGSKVSIKPANGKPTTQHSPGSATQSAQGATTQRSGKAGGHKKANPS